MASPDSEDRIRELEERMAAMPGSRIFVGLAEEYRRAGRYEDALNTLKKGLEGHPTYLSAQIALARLYQETWRNPEAIEAFSKVLAMDRENLVAAKALSELYETSQNPVEAIKKLKLYRAISGDRSIDEKIGRMEALIHQPGESAAPLAVSLEELSFPSESALPASLDPNETVSIPGAAIPHDRTPEPSAELPAAGEAVPPAAASPARTPARREAGPGEGVTRQLAALSLGEAPSDDDGSERETAEQTPVPNEELPPSRTLADLYYKQGFIDDARKIYEKLAVANPMDESVTRRLTVLRKPSRRRAARLESWLAGIQSRARAGRA